MYDFKPFSKLINQRFVELSKHELYVVGDDNRAFEAQYLAAFPEGTNPIYKSVTEHDCSCCKQFIRNIGNVVAILDGKVETVWDIVGAEYPYDIVAANLNEFVKSLPITNLFRSQEPSYGAEQTKQLVDGQVLNWNHFHSGKIAARHMSTTPDAITGKFRTDRGVFKRGLDELQPSAVQEVLDLIAAKSLYRGEENLHAVKEFQKSQQAYSKLDAAGKDLFTWAVTTGTHFRNTAIGTLVQDLSEGKPVEAAVGSFEAKVAPTNYKRTTALITPRMIEDAMKVINSEGLETALERRFAKLSDVTVNNVLWVDNVAKSKMKGGLESLLLGAVKAPVLDKTGEDISITDFMTKVLPVAESIDMLVKGAHMNNFMSITAPVHADAANLFKWDNNFAWSYNGNITDSIKERVKTAGGNVTSAKLRVSLAWFNHDDLDIHVYEPNGNHIYFGNREGKLDVDMHVGRGTTRTPVENVSWKSVQDGVYQVKANQYNQRESTCVGCVVEVESNGALTQLTYAPTLKGPVHIADLTVQNGVVLKIEPGPGVTGGGISQDKWGLKTETLVKVDTLMYSPSFWDDNAVGNKHWFFILNGCKNDEPTRGIYNEFLKSDLDKHRKVLEVLGDKTKCVPTDDQLSGLGFSSTKQDSVTVVVKGAKLHKTFNIKF